MLLWWCGQHPAHLIHSEVVVVVVCKYYLPLPGSKLRQSAWLNIKPLQASCPLKATNGLSYALIRMNDSECICLISRSPPFFLRDIKVSVQLQERSDPSRPAAFIRPHVETLQLDDEAPDSLIWRRVEVQTHVFGSSVGHISHVSAHQRFKKLQIITGNI